MPATKSMPGHMLRASRRQGLLADPWGWVLALVVIFVLALLAQGCGDAKRPPGMTTVYYVGFPSEEERARVGRSTHVWDEQGWPAQATNVELVDPDPQSVPPVVYGGDPWFRVHTGPDPRTDQQAVAITETGSSTQPGGLIVCTRTAEWAVVHELLHVEIWREGVPLESPEQYQHLDYGRWKLVNHVMYDLKDTWTLP